MTVRHHTSGHGKNACPSPYITSAGRQALENELKQLWTRRGDVTQHLAAAAAEGDRSENAEYIYRKKELREIDRRIRYLQKRLPALVVIDRLPEQRNCVFFGAWVLLSDDDDPQQQQTAEYRIVGPDETNPKLGWISVDSPLSKALLKRQIDDVIIADTPAGPKRWTIHSIRYSETSSSS